MNLTLHVWRQATPTAAGKLATYTLDDVTPEMSFLEMFDVLNETLVERGEEPVAFSHDCRAVNVTSERSVCDAGA